MPKNTNGKAPPELYTSLVVSQELSNRLRYARALTQRKQKEIVATAVERYLDELGVPRTLPKLKGPGA